MLTHVADPRRVSLGSPVAALSLVDFSLFTGWIFALIVGGQAGQRRIWASNSPTPYAHSLFKTGELEGNKRLRSQLRQRDWIH